MNVPVQVGDRIVDCVDQSRAESMGRGFNATVIRARKTGKIMRIILEKMTSGVGDVEDPGTHQDSRLGHFKEALFNTDGAPTGVIQGMPFVYYPKSIPTIDPLPKRKKRKKK